MADKELTRKEQIALLKKSVQEWNRWRSENPDAKPNLIDADLIDANLSDANLTGARLQGANLSDPNLSDANLSDAHLSGANLSRANLHNSDLRGAKLRGANLRGVRHLTCLVLREAIWWEEAYRDSELACGASIPEPPKEE